MTAAALSKSERTRLFIIEQAANLFNKQGYAGTSMDDILQATGLSKGGIYGNFKSKEEIALAAFDHAVQLVSQEISRRTKQRPHVLDKLRAVVEFYHDRMFSPPVEGGCPLQNTAIEADDSNPALRERVQQAIAEWAERIRFVLQRGVERGEVCPDADLQAFTVQFIATLEGAIMLSRLYRNIDYYNLVSTQLFQMIEQLRPIQSSPEL